MDIGEGIINVINLGGEGYGERIANHYGAKKEEYDEMIGDCLKKLYSAQKFTDAIDAIFKDLTAEQRLMVLAFNHADGILENDMKQRQR